MTPRISIVRAGEGVDEGLVQRLSKALAAVLHIECSVEPEVLDIAPAADPDRRQHRADEILRLLGDSEPSAAVRRLGVTAQDLFLPVFTHVFGAGQLTGSCAVVSLYRLREEAYGLPESQLLLEERLLKEALHELGHTGGLRHCSVWQCVMSCSSGVELVDLKSAQFCTHCHHALQRALHGHAAVPHLHSQIPNS